ncbi:hypothetical protein B566_EDAN002215 [Ephemera danica]|nr:hypothetical protein B566_EDAN002215 [Ephemera danica]
MSYSYGSDPEDEEPSYSRATQKLYQSVKPKSRRYVDDDDDAFVQASYRGEDSEDEGPISYARAPPKSYHSVVKPKSRRHVAADDNFVQASYSYEGEGVAWIRAINGDFPPNAVVGGNNHLGDIYVARAEFQSQLIPGKLIPKYRSCFITVNGTEMKINDYEVLQCNQPMMLEWNHMKKGDGIPINAVDGGVDDVGDTLFIGRVEHGNSAIVGKVEQSTQMCLILCANQEHAYYTYDILVYSDTYLKKYAVSHLTGAMRMMQLQDGDSSPNIPSSSGRRPSLLQPPSRPTLNAGIQERKPLKKGFSVEQLAPTDSTYKWVEGKMKKDSQVKYNIVKIERVYFADKADKSNSYVGAGNAAGEFQMMLCRVALGKVHDCPQNKTFSHAPPGCHSVCGGTTTKEYIVYRGEQAFPGFLITYKR